VGSALSSSKVYSQKELPRPHGDVMDGGSFFFKHINTGLSSSAIDGFSVYEHYSTEIQKVFHRTQEIPGSSVETSIKTDVRCATLIAWKDAHGLVPSTSPWFDASPPAYFDTKSSDFIAILFT
jgi:hypothetical protein